MMKLMKILLTLIKPNSPLVRRVRLDNWQTTKVKKDRLPMNYYSINKISEMPPLPDWARVDPSIGDGVSSFVNDYIDYAKCVAPMTPRIFHESAALLLPAIGIARRLVLPMAFGNIYPNLFIVWIAQSTLFNKTTALDIARSLARDVFPHLLSVQDTTPEALYSDLAGHEPSNYSSFTKQEQENWRHERNFSAQKGLLLDEMSGLMAGAGKDYNAGLIEAFMKFYDCDPLFDRSTKKDGRIVIRDSYLSLLGASTPLGMSHYLNTNRLWANGWWIRFAILTPENRWPEWREAISTTRPAHLVSDLQSLYTKLSEPKYPDPPRALSVTLGTDVNDVWGKYDKALRYDLLKTPNLDNRLFPTYGRLPSTGLKIAMILAAMDWKDEPAPRIELPHIVGAISIAEDWRASAHRVISITSVNKVHNMQDRIVRIIQKYAQEGGATMRDLTRSMTTETSNDIEDALEKMESEKMIRIDDVKPGKQGGRPTKRYNLI